MSEHAADADVFCLQEVYKDTRAIAKKLLPAFTELYEHKRTPKMLRFPLATYLREYIVLVSHKPLFLFKEGYGIALYTHIKYYGCDMHIVNVHGIAQPGHKLDTDIRLRQSEEILNTLQDAKGLKIVGGDFNLLPETESIRMFEQAGYKNLITEYGIETTRNHLAWDKHPGDPQMFADYIFVSPDVRVLAFTVPNVEVSDHLPLILQIKV